MSRTYKSERHFALEDNYPSCSGPCSQGRRQCGTPDACRLPDDGDCLPLFRWLGVALALVVCAVVFALIFGGVR